MCIADATIATGRGKKIDRNPQKTLQTPFPGMAIAVRPRRHGISRAEQIQLR